MAIDARDDLIVVSEGLLGFDNLFDNNNFGNDIDAVEIVSIDIGGGPQAVGAGVVTSNFDLGVLSVGNVGFPGQKKVSADRKCQQAPRFTPFSQRFTAISIAGANRRVSSQTVCFVAQGAFGHACPQASCAHAGIHD